MNKFGTAGSQGGADACQNVRGMTRKFFRHGLNGLSDNVLDASPPSAVDIRNDPPDRVHQQNRLTVRHLDGEKHIGLIGDQGISHARCCVLFHNFYAGAMDLLDAYQTVGIKAPADGTAIFHDMGRQVSDRFADVETLIGALALAPFSCKHTMPHAGCFRDV